MVKKKFRSSDTDTASQLVDLVNSSGLRNTATLCEWQWRSWDSFFMNDFKRVVGITSYQHFPFSRSFMIFKYVTIHNANHLSVIVYFYQSDSGLT